MKLQFTADGRAMLEKKAIRSPFHASDDMSALQWDRVENKSSVVVYAGGALVLLWFSSTIVSAVNAVPLVSLPAFGLAIVFPGHVSLCAC